MENNIDQVCDELTSKIETLRQVFKKKPQSDLTFITGNTETNKDEKIEPLEKTVREAVFELEKTKKHFKSKTIKEVREKLIRALEE